MTWVFTTAVLLLFPSPALAHLFGGGHEELSWLNFDPFTLVLLLLTAAMYHRGYKATSDRQGGQKRAIYFWTGWACLFLVLATPLDPLGEELFFVHMIQHEVMMLVAAPLLVLSRPSGALLRGGPTTLAPLFGGLVRRKTSQSLHKGIFSPAGAWTIHLIGLWGWHLPVLFNASLENSAVHTVQHISFMFIGLLFWWALFRGRACRVNGGLGVIYLFTTAIHASILGALLTFSPTVWYTTYLATAPSWGLSALEDQQLGGVIMWIPAGIVYILATGMMFARVLGEGNEVLGEGN